MDLKVAKKRIREREKEGRYKDFEVELKYDKVNEQQKFSDLYSLYRYVYKEVSFWEDKTEGIKKYFQTSIHHFTEIKDAIVNSLNDERKGINHTREIIKKAHWNCQQVITSTTPEVQYLISLEKDHTGQVLESAYNFFFNRGSNINLNVPANFEGYIHAFEFKNKDFKPFKRTKAEKPAISRLRNDFEDDLDDYRKRLSNLLETYESKSEEFYAASKENQQYFDKETLDWRSHLQEELAKFKEDKIEEFKELKQEYREQLRLRTSVEYWENRAKKMRQLGRWYTRGVITGVFIIAGLISLILLNPEIIPSFGGNTEQAVKWTILFIAAISFMAYVVRAFTKLMFSSFHLARDAEERVELTHSYLSLRDEAGDLTPEERLMVMQSLFSRAESGLLRNDSSPAMPSDIVSKILKSGSQ